MQELYSKLFIIVTTFSIQTFIALLAALLLLVYFYNIPYNGGVCVCLCNVFGFSKLTTTIKYVCGDVD